MDKPTPKQRIEKLKSVKKQLEETYCLGKFAEDKNTYKDVIAALNARIELIRSGQV